MPDPLVSAHIEAQRRLRAVVVQAITQIWRGLPGYDKADLPQWYSNALPVVLASQRQSVALTEGFLAQFLKRPPLGVSPEHLIGAAVRNGTSPQTVYTRPFISLWTDLKAGKQFEQASSAALARATSSAEMDTQLSMRATADAVQQADDGIYGYQRVADPGACEFCSTIDGAYVKSADAYPLHNRCGCGLEPLTAPHPRAAKLPSGVAVHQHGELGSVLTDSAHSFTTESEALR